LNLNSVSSIACSRAQKRAGIGVG